LKSFNEHIGCTICDSFDITTSRRGPWVSKPIGTKLIGATTKYTNSISKGFTCLLHSTTSSNSGSWTYQSGPNTTNGPTEDENGVWDKELFKCGENECKSPVIREDDGLERDDLDTIDKFFSNDDLGKFVLA